MKQYTVIFILTTPSLLKKHFNSNRSYLFHNYSLNLLAHTFSYYFSSRCYPTITSNLYNKQAQNKTLMLTEKKTKETKAEVIIQDHRILELETLLDKKEVKGLVLGKNVGSKERSKKIRKNKMLSSCPFCSRPRNNSHFLCQRGHTSLHSSCCGLSGRKPSSA